MGRRHASSSSNATSISGLSLTQMSLEIPVLCASFRSWHVSSASRSAPNAQRDKGHGKNSRVGPTGKRNRVLQHIQGESRHHKNKEPRRGGALRRVANPIIWTGTGPAVLQSAVLW